MADDNMEVDTKEEEEYDILGIFEAYIDCINPADDTRTQRNLHQLNQYVHPRCIYSSRNLASVAEYQEIIEEDIKDNRPRLYFEVIPDLVIVDWEEDLLSARIRWVFDERTLDDGQQYEHVFKQKYEHVIYQFRRGKIIRVWSLREAEGMYDWNREGSRETLSPQYTP